MDRSVDVSLMIRKRPSGAMSQLIGPVRIPVSIMWVWNNACGFFEYGPGGDVDSHHLGIGRDVEQLLFARSIVFCKARDLSCLRPTQSITSGVPAPDRDRVRCLTAQYRRLRQARTAVIQLHRQILHTIDHLQEALRLPAPAAACDRAPMPRTGSRRLHG